MEIQRHGVNVIMYTTFLSHSRLERNVHFKFFYPEQHPELALATALVHMFGGLLK